jgi:hypothetical protein
MSFKQAEAMFGKDQIRELAQEPDGLRYLKLRSLNRLEYLKRLFESAGIEPANTSAKAMFKEAFETPAIGLSQIDELIRCTYQQQRTDRRSREPELVSQLYRLQTFDWGGLHQNSLEKTIVDNYVKKITDYELLTHKIENELQSSMRGYVLCSWYNHWTSIIIEDLFRDHPNVLPAIGQVKKIDFFVRNVPFDLKVTYLPEGFIKDRRRKDGLRPELTLLRQGARERNIHFDNDISDAKLLEDLGLKHRDHPARQSQQLIMELREYRSAVLARCLRAPAELLRWLYENQGVRRFDSSNRLFLVLIDQASPFDSWKLKRARPLLAERIKMHLDKMPSNPGKEVQFEWEGRMYAALADVVFVVHPNELP